MWCFFLMQIRLVVSVLYSNLQVVFEGAREQSAAVSVDLSDFSSDVSHFDCARDPCNAMGDSRMSVRFLEPSQNR